MRVRLGDYIKEYSVRNKFGEDIPVFSVTNTQGFCRDYFGKDVSSKDRTTYKIVPKGYFAYNPSRINVGSVDWQRREDRVIVSPLYNVFSVSPELDQQYLYYYLKSDIGLFYIKAAATGSVRDNLKFAMLADFQISLPSIEKQREIVDELDRAKEIINLYNQQLKALDDLVKARFVEMFGQEINSVRLGDCCDIHARIGWQALTKNEHRQSGDYMLVTGTDFKDGRVDFNTCVYVDKERYEMDKHIILKENDVLITKDGTIGKVAIVHDLPKPATLNSGVFVVRPDKRFNKEYISYVFRGPLFERFIELSKTGATIKHLNQKHLLEFNIPVPSMEKQKMFADFFKEVDKSKFVVQKALINTLVLDSLIYGHNQGEYKNDKW